jgi:general stress protein 26
MTDLTKTQNEPITQLFDKIGSTHAVMLGLDQTGQKMQPMAPQTDDDRNSIWFYAKRNSEIGAAIVQHKHSRARISVVGPDHDYYASLSGVISQETDTRIVDRFWSSVVAAWYDGDKADPNLMMLRFDPTEADIWASSGSVMRFAWEIAKANLNDEEPDVGVSTHVVFPMASNHVEAAQ